jgi:hypothetical protein
MNSEFDPATRSRRSMNRQRRLIMRLYCLANAVPQLAAALVLCLLAAGIANAQQITGVPGSPSATLTINGKQLPPPPLPFGGVIKESYLNSTPYWPPRVVPPKGAPNILLIMTDDQGYGVSSTFGGVIPTPALDRIAKAGLRYTQFHSTALCSPTRAALITGRNHHSVGTGVIGELSTGYPGYDSIIGPENATIGTTTRRAFNTALPVPSTSGRSAWVFSIFTDFWAARPTNGHPTSFATRARCFHGSSSPTTTLPPTWRTTLSSISAN